MTLFLFLAAAAGGAGATLALRYRLPSVAGIAVVALAVCGLLALLMPPGAALAVGDAQLIAGPYARWFLLAASGALLVAQVAGAANGAPRNLPLAALAGLGTVAAAVTVTEPAAAMLAVSAAGLAGIIAALGNSVSMPTLRVAADGLRLVALAGLLGLAGIALVGTAAAHPTPEMVGTGVLAVGAAAAVRLGAVPLHIPAARLVEMARLAAVPLVAAWLPAAFALICMGWVGTTLGATGAATPLAHLALALVGAVTIAVAGVVALLDDDLGRLLGYGLIADGGFVILAAASSEPAVFPAVRTWLVFMGLSRTVMAAALLSLHGSFGTRHVGELSGWLRRMPLTGLALLTAALVGVGLPTMLPFEARRTLAVGAFGEPLGLLALAFGALPLLGLARLAWVGVNAPGPAVAEARGEWPLERPDGSLPPRERLVALWRLDRVPIAAGVALLLGLLAVAAAFGVGDLAGAAAAAGS
jgi:formate hydrogenlyase subunit 3/multisubunit Na+/H+ antiporter MnhD subunit